MCVNYKISQNPPKMLELAVEHLAAFSEILDDFQVLASLKWNEILWVIFEVWDQTQWVLGPQDNFKKHLEMSNFRVLHIVKLAVCRTCVVQPKTEYLGHWAVVHWHSGPMSKMCTGTVAQCPRYSVSGCTTQVHQQRGPVSKCTGTWARYNLCTVSTKCAEAESYQVHWQSGRPGARQSMATACNCPCAGTTLGALWRNCLKMTPNNVTASGYFAHHVRPYWEPAQPLL